MAATVSPRRNACHASPLRAGMTRVPMTTANGHQDQPERMGEDVPTHDRKGGRDEEGDAEGMSQTERPMPQHVHADGGDREGQPCSSSQKPLSPSLAGIPDLSRQESGYEAGDDSLAPSTSASRSRPPVPSAFRTGWHAATPARPCSCGWPRAPARSSCLPLRASPAPPAPPPPGAERRRWSSCSSRGRHGLSSSPATLRRPTIGHAATGLPRRVGPGRDIAPQPAEFRSGLDRRRRRSPQYWASTPLGMVREPSPLRFQRCLTSTDGKSKARC